MERLAGQFAQRLPLNHSFPPHRANVQRMSLLDSAHDEPIVSVKYLQRVYIRHKGRFPVTMAHERRRAPRCPLIASVEVIELATDRHLRARISGLSLTGCYLDTTNFLRAGTEVRLCISHHDTMFTALGVVASCQPNMGMGVRFTDVQLDQHAILDKWLAELV